MPKRLSAVLVIWLTFLHPSDALARRGRRYLVRGRVVAKADRSHCLTSSFAYWVFTVPEITPPPCRPRLVDYLVTADEWNQANVAAMLRRLGQTASPTMKLSGVRFQPRLLVVPKERQSYDVSFVNRDRFVHEVVCPKNRGASVTLAPMATETMTFEGLGPLSVGEVDWFTLRDRRFAHMRGAVVFVRSTAVAVPGPSGGFSLQLGPGTHTLKLWHRGRRVAKKTVTVRRRTPPVVFDLVGRAAPRPRADARPRPTARQQGRRGRRRHRRRRRR